MPMTKKGREIIAAMRKEYGKTRGTGVFYASRNKGTISGVDALPPLSDVLKRKDFKNGVVDSMYARDMIADRARRTRDAEQLNWDPKWIKPPALKEGDDPVKPAGNANKFFQAFRRGARDAGARPGWNGKNFRHRWAVVSQDAMQRGKQPADAIGAVVSDMRRRSRDTMTYGASMDAAPRYNRDSRTRRTAMRDARTTIADAARSTRDAAEHPMVQMHQALADHHQEVGMAHSAKAQGPGGRSQRHEAAASEHSDAFEVHHAAAEAYKKNPALAHNAAAHAFRASARAHQASAYAGGVST